MNDPAPTLTITLTLNKRDARYVLEALQELENKWLTINRTTIDEDEQADYGMDALDLHGSREFIKDEAVAAFGPSVMDFSREQIPVTAPRPADSLHSHSMSSPVASVFSSRESREGL